MPRRFKGAGHPKLAKSAYAAQHLAKHAACYLPARRAFNEFVLRTEEDLRPHHRLLEQQIIGAFHSRSFSRTRECRAVVLHETMPRSQIVPSRRCLPTPSKSHALRRPFPRWCDEPREESFPPRQSERRPDFPKSHPRESRMVAAPLDVPEVDPAKILGASARADLGHMPEVSEIENYPSFHPPLNLEPMPLILACIPSAHAP